ncbi:MAG: SMP-30/gluconolactonase/LRE family protein [Deltaproteobacteria bacterium]|nr:SMP-30/gluconolactonase/LRE family protein [Deltaproteobacteria bacterium]
MADNPIKGFQVDPADVQYIGENLQRPECILAESNGTLWSADARGGVVKLSPDGSQEIITQTFDASFTHAANDASRFTEGTLPNGLAFAENGDILISNFGTDVLEVMTRDGRTRLLYDSIDGQPIGKVNFVLRDRQNRIWLTISTRTKNWMKAVSPNIADGYIALADDQGLRIVADGFKFTNEIRLDAREEFMYIVETCGQCISRMRVQSDGSLTQREVYGPSKLGKYGFPDGIAFDSYGNLWGTLVMVDQVFAITPDGRFHVILDDTNEKPALALEQAFTEDRVTPDDMLACGGNIASWFSSVTFGGSDLKTVYIGSLRGKRIPYFHSPVAGLPMVHWSNKS